MKTRRNDARELLNRFSDRYSARSTDAAQIIERQVIGANVGANGYLTLPQANRLTKELRLSADSILLDIGTGRGWPGLYISERTGCRAVLSDVPLEAIRVATTQAHETGVSSRVSTMLASAVHLPFAGKSFDAICHSDTL